MEYNIGVSVLDGWKIVRKIGEGSYGQVFEVQKTSDGVRPITSALKVIRIPYNEAELKSAYSEGMDNKSATSYFRGFVDEIKNEINVMSELKAHQGVVSCEDYKIIEYSDKVHWDILIRMELLTPLMDYTKENKLTTQEILRLGIEISDVLSYCHAKGMIHRDVKPENIFIDELGHFKLGDFGIARAMEKSTKGMSSKGTESYMAPEVFLYQDYDKSVDIYSLGLVLYKYFNNNRLPFVPQGTIKPEDRTDAIKKRIRGDKFPRIPHESKRLNAILQKACAYEASNRYNSAEELQDALREYMQNSNKLLSWIRKYICDWEESGIHRAEKDLEPLEVVSNEQSDEPNDKPSDERTIPRVISWKNWQKKMKETDHLQNSENPDKPKNDDYHDKELRTRYSITITIVVFLALLTGIGIWASRNPQSGPSYIQRLVWQVIPSPIPSPISDPSPNPVASVVHTQRTTGAVALPVNNVVFRTGPNSSYMDVFTVFETEANRMNFIAITKEEGDGFDWVLVEFSYNGKLWRCYAPMKQFEIQGDISTVEYRHDKQTVTKQMRVYAAPNDNGASRGILYPGDEITMLSEEGNYAYIEYYEDEMNKDCLTRGYINIGVLEGVINEEFLESGYYKVVDRIEPLQLKGEPRLFITDEDKNSLSLVPIGDILYLVKESANGCALVRWGDIEAYAEVCYLQRVE